MKRILENSDAKVRMISEMPLTTIAKKTVKARIEAIPELQALHAEWNRLVWKTYWLHYATNFSEKRLVKYSELAHQTELAKYYVCAAITLADGRAKAFRSLRKRLRKLQEELQKLREANGKKARKLRKIRELREEIRRLRKANHQRNFNEPLQLTRDRTYYLHENEDGRIHVSISCIPKKPIKAGLVFGRDDANEEWLNEALHSDEGIRIKGARLLERDGEYWLYITVEKEVDVPNPLDCETLIGIDLGMNRLAVATAITRDGIPHRPLFVHGGLVRHLQLERRRREDDLKSNGFDTESMRRYYDRRIDEELHKASKQIVEYAKRFPNPVIIIGRSRFKKNPGNSKTQRYLFAHWARKRLGDYVKYKARWDGIPTVFVSECRSSSQCHRCGSGGERDRETFRCLKCNKFFDAEFNASVNIAFKWLERFDSCTL